MAFLERSIAKQLKWLYPTAPERADTWLEQEIFRLGLAGQGRWWYTLVLRLFVNT